jgi:apolipoprotein D and lipocalin family protein
MIYKSQLSKWLLLILAGLFTNSCQELPENISPVKNFDLGRYLGQWYEIARLDHSFERGLNGVTATYSKNENGSVKVLNRGFKTAKSSWSQSEGRAEFVSDSTIGHLRVSFFRPFYGSYVVFELDSAYQYAYVTSSSRKYLWLLSRNPQISDQQKSDFIQKTKSLGFATESLIWVEHNQGILKDSLQ